MSSHPGPQGVGLPCPPETRGVAWASCASWLSHPSPATEPQSLRAVGADAPSPALRVSGPPAQPCPTGHGQQSLTCSQDPSARVCLGLLMIHRGTHAHTCASPRLHPYAHMHVVTGVRPHTRILPPLDVRGPLPTQRTDGGRRSVGGGGGRVTLDGGREPPAPPASARAPDTCSRGSREGAAHRLGGLSEMSPRGCWRPKQPECPCREVGAHEAGHLVLRGVGTQPRAGLRAPRSASSSGDQARLALSLWEPAVHLCMGVRARVYT